MSDEEEGYQLLETIKIHGELIHKWPCIDIGPAKLFFKPREYECGGFDAMVVEWVSSDDKGEWFVVTWEATAFFDGVRHLNLKDGYLNYPNILRQLEIMKKLRELEEKYCRLDNIDKSV